MRFVLVTSLLLCALPARADAAVPLERRAQHVRQALLSAEREISAGKPALAQRRLRSAVARFPGEAVLLARYAALLLPLTQSDRPQTPTATTQAATELLAQVARARTVPGHLIATRDTESERLVGLYVAYAEALLGQLDEALSQVVEVGQLQDASTVLVLRQIAAFAVRADQLPVAEQALALARQYVPQDLPLSGELGHVLLAEGREELSLAVLAERFSLTPDALVARSDLAYALATLGRPGEGLSLLNDARAACAGERACALLAGRLALESGRPAEALAFVAQWSAASDLDALFLAADAQERAGQLTAARATYERLLRLRPESARAKQALQQLSGSNAPHD